MRQGPVYPGARGSARRQAFLEWLTAHRIDPNRVPEASRVVVVGNRVTWQEIVTMYRTGGRMRPALTINTRGEPVWHLRRRYRRITTALPPTTREDQ